MFGGGAGTGTRSFPSSATAASNPSTAKMIADEKADWKPLVSAASGLLPSAWDTATVERIATPTAPPIWNDELVSPDASPAYRLGDAGQRADRPRDVGRPEPGAEDQQPEEDVPEIGAVDGHLGGPESRGP